MCISIWHFSVVASLHSTRPDVDGKMGVRFPPRMSRGHGPDGETGAASLKELRFRPAASTGSARRAGNFFLGRGGFAGRLRPMLDSADARRRWAGVFCLAVAAGMLIWGRTVFEDRLAGATFLLYWLVCFAFTFSAIFLALRDVSAVRRRAREEQRRLIERALAEAKPVEERDEPDP